MTNFPLISVIVPSYNVAATLAETVESIINQTYQNLEIILVDDCSTDGATPALADEYANRDSRVRVIHKAVNEDLTLARATGFGIATGDYVTFIDADDVFTPDAIQTLWEIHCDTDADISMAGYVFCDGNLTPKEPRWPKGPLNDEVTVYPHDEMLDLFLRGMAVWKHNNNPDNAYCKLFRREILTDLDWQATDYRIGEDTPFSLLTFARAQKVAVSNRVILYYRNLDTSKSRMFNWKFAYQKQSITASQMIENMVDLAHHTLPEQFNLGIAHTALRLNKYYRQAEGMAFLNGYLALVEQRDADLVETRKELRTTQAALNNTLAKSDQLSATIARLEGILHARNEVIADLNEFVKERDHKIHELERTQLNLTQEIANIHNSTTWKVGKLATSPARVAKNLTNRNN